MGIIRRKRLLPPPPTSTLIVEKPRSAENGHTCAPVTVTLLYHG